MLPEVYLFRYDVFYESSESIGSAKSQEDVVRMEKWNKSYLITFNNANCGTLCLGLISKSNEKCL